MKKQTGQYQFEVIFTPQEEGGFTVEVPDLPGCISEGETLEEAEKNIHEAIELYLETLDERGIPLPEREPLKMLKMNVTIVRLDRHKKSYA
ncbi:type II toxin-antitoxin system HicB family antitoxin [Patescibacteria group bacterium]|nr:type II toxin-antitoxin system HicB family antitoxin [Patescibacteria group bacterium]MBU1703726.1 type II toxin-antitoxin system HicB family antitoxin [Patescibacteria group bacterium]MBU1953625.1 type II toxin-antitoxin system HicB family antitoxin [Patescibacteria group bacterium]